MCQTLTADSTFVNSDGPVAELIFARAMALNLYSACKFNMAQISGLLITGCWLIFLGFWIASARGAKPVAERTNFSLALRYRVPLICQLSFDLDSNSSRASELFADTTFNNRTSPQPGGLRARFIIFDMGAADSGRELEQRRDL